MKYFIIAGEQSGDLHGSNLVKELIKADPRAEISCWGGDLMQSAGATLLMHYKKTAFMGFLEIVKNLGTISENLSLCKKHITQVNPNVIILIDYPGFNLRIAEFAKRSGFRVFYYISPKLWAWKENRVEKIKRYIDKMYIIFPFEVDFYKKHNIDVEYRGNPLMDEAEKKILTFPGKTEIQKSLGLEEKPVIVLLAGSRKHEVEQILPKMLKIVRHFREYQFVLAGVKNLPDELYYKIIGNEPVSLIKEKTYEILYISHAAIVTSGTATLETSLLNIPQVVCFRGDFFSMLIAWIVIKVKYISLVNLIMGREVVKELVQYSLTEKNLLSELKAVLPGGAGREKILSDYKLLKDKLGPVGASGRIARDMVSVLDEEMGRAKVKSKK
jgi:lipid-A-disaccharide synthase